jgi:proteasome assembly chaperone (PAC2) family protein
MDGARVHENINWQEKPDLFKPYLVLAFDGWTNAGQVATAVTWYLIRKLKAIPFAGLRPDEFFIYQASGGEQQRPLVNIEGGLIQSLNIVTTNFSYCKDIRGMHDLIIASGPEPQQEWVKYTGLILDFAREFRVDKIAAIGGSFEAIPHTVPTRITGVVNQVSLLDEIKVQGIEPVSYKGPSSLYSLIMIEAAKRGLPMFSLWASTPHYIQVINHIAAYKLLLTLCKMLDLNLDLSDAQRDSEDLITRIDQAVSQKPELQKHLKMIENEYRKGRPQIKKPISQNIVREIEDLLKGKQGPEFPG